MLNIIATFILIYLVFRIVITYVVPWIVRWYLKRHRKRFYRENPEAARAAEKRQRMRSSRSTDAGRKKQPDTDKIGEYVDFEEITDDSGDNDADSKHQ